MTALHLDDFSHYSNDQLLFLVKQRDKDAFAALYDRQAQIVYNLLISIVGDIALAERLLQAVFLQLWEDTDSCIGSGTLTVWLYRQARTKALALVDKESPTGMPFPINQTSEPTRPAQQVQSILQQMPHEERRCVELAYFAGMSQAQIASYTNLPLKTIKFHLRSGIEMLEKFLLVLAGQAT